jgi:hypothetical protein
MIAFFIFKQQFCMLFSFLALVYNYKAQFIVLYGSNRKSHLIDFLNW